MRLGPARVFFCIGGIIAALNGPLSLVAQSTGVGADLHGTDVSVPYVGCASFGQSSASEPPAGTSKSVSISLKDAEALAYYESADGIGLLAPRGWFCEGTSGSGGAALFLSPVPIHYTSSGWHGLEGTAIEFNYISGENSGTYDIARIMARVFPEYRTVARGILKDFDFRLPSGPYPKDTLTRVGKTIVEFKTPAQTEGLGNFDSWLKKSDTPIQGAAILSTDSRKPFSSSTHVVLLSVRFPPDLVPLAPPIIHNVEQNALDGAYK
jgi:hypothetical protein